MWVGVLIVLLAGAPARGTPYSAYQYYELDTEDDDDTDFDDSYDDDLASGLELTTVSDAPIRFKRHEDHQELRTLNPAEINDVKDALKEIFYGNKIDSWTTSEASQDASYTDVYDYVDTNGPHSTYPPNITHDAPHDLVQKWIPGHKGPSTTTQHESPTMVVRHWSPEVAGQKTSDTRSPDEEDFEKVTLTATARMWRPQTDDRPWSPTAKKPQSSASRSTDSTQDKLQSSSTTDEHSDESTHSSTTESSTTSYKTSSTTDKTSTTTDETSPTFDAIPASTNTYIREVDVQRLITLNEATLRTTVGDEELERMVVAMRINKLTITARTVNGTGYNTTMAPNTTTVTTTTTTTTRPTTTTRSPRMDINAIIAIIANLTYDYDWNLTEQFNQTLIKYGVPTCPTATTPTTTTTTISPYEFANTSVVSKCFVCGLRTKEIPRNAHCADAFAGDFLPLMPVDARARASIAKFRKYCRYLNVRNYVMNPSEPRSIYGRFTGGCAVRWTDLTGVYTQRTCRNRFRPLMGKHFASKRMAKLELALTNVENGCIISPMATLLPLSRGMSLYARFHACVCTGSWCNRAIRIQQWNLHLTILWTLTNTLIL